MLSKNNHQEIVNRNQKKKQRFALKKLTWGVASVLVGFTFMGVSAHASDNLATNQTLSVVNDQQSVPSIVNQSAVVDTTTDIAKVPADYATAMQGFRPSNASPDFGNTAQTIAVAQKGAQENGGANGFSTAGWTMTNGKYIINLPGSYQHNQADENELVDLNNLTDKQHQEITNFSAQMINQIRSQVQSQVGGTKVSAGFVKVSPYATQLGQEAVDSAYANAPKMTHERDALKAYVNSKGLNTNFVGENLASGIIAENFVNQIPGFKLNMDMVKQSIYNILLSMMYFDKNSNELGAGGHTTAILNDPYYNGNTSEGGNAIALDGNGKIIGNQYLAVSLDHMGQVHFNFLSDATATPAVKARLAQGAVELGVNNLPSKPDSSSAETPSSSASSSAASSAGTPSSSASSSATSSAVTPSSSASSSAASSATTPSSSASSSAASSAETPSSSASSSATFSAATPSSSASSSVTSSAATPNSSASSSAASSAETPSSSASSSAASSAATPSSSASSSATSSAATPSSSASSSAASSATTPSSSASSSAASSATTPSSSASSSAASSATTPSSSASSSAASSAGMPSSSASSSAASSATTPSSSASLMDTTHSLKSQGASDSEQAISLGHNSQALNKGNQDRLPQTGNQDQTAMLSLGLISLFSMFGLAGGIKRRYNK